MFVSARIFVPLGQPIIDQVNVVLSLANTNQKIVWLYVAMEKSARMNILDALDHLVGEHQDCMQRKATMTIVKQIL